jgi:Osmosensitive K+ channel His kinase sensor domain
VLARRPAMALVDDLAHCNVPRAGHARRWQDAAELLAAGIDVISTVSIGHLESLSDVVAKITGVPHRETVPDPVVRAAGEVELVDVAPQALQERLAHSLIYPAERAGAALGSWSRLRTCPRCVSLPCCGWLASWPASAGGPAPAARLRVTVIPGSGWWSRSAAARRARR